MGETKISLPQVKINVEYGKGRWSQVFHITDLDGREIVLHQKDAAAMAKNILEIVKKK